MGEAAVALGRAVGYASAGTVEFIVDRDGAFYFLEVNTRLQVEHPVTELICGVDLVAEQLRVARGEVLRWSSPPPRRGHAIEVRLCAEDPARGFLPTTGELVELALPPDAAVRADLGVVTGSSIGIHYDSMIGKIIAYGDSRAEAAARLRRALEHTLVAGITTNLELLVRLLGHPAFLAAELDTHFLERHAASLSGEPRDGAADSAESAPTAEQVEAMLAATLCGLAERRGARSLEAVPLGWRNVRYPGAATRFAFGERDFAVSYQLLDGGRVELAIEGHRFVVTSFAAAAQSAAGWQVEAVLALPPPSTETGDGAAASAAAAPHQPIGQRRRWRLARRGDRWWVAARGRAVAFAEAPRFPEPVKAAPSGSVLAPMPGKVVKLLVAVGDAVAAGAPILMLEAMKMEHTLRVAQDGTVTQLFVRVGDQVAADEVLAVVS
jgi:acetyl/propionyl-CoA carboxylase alpha subunit